MKKSMNNKIKALQSKVENQAEFMKKLAELDEKGQLTQDVLDQVNGGSAISIKKPIIDLPVLGIWLPPTFPDTTL
ncbi:hypothetical protein [Spirosoma flavum]|uniref:Bacteriocin n=1 Tax=Spirosoma flavum TaxID=2048557 RepID=A0ABW6AKW1_9BACT